MQLSEMIQTVLTEAAQCVQQGVDPEISFDVDGEFAALTGVELSDDRRHITVVLETSKAAEDG